MSPKMRFRDISPPRQNPTARAGAYSLLPIPYCLFPTAYSLLPIPYCLLPTAYCPMIIYARNPKKNDQRVTHT
jgi:hypothetical protein